MSLIMVISWGKGFLSVCILLDIQPLALYVRKYCHFSMENEYIPLAEKRRNWVIKPVNTW